MSQQEPLIDKQRFLSGLKLTFKVALIIYLITAILWLLIWRDILTYPFEIISLAMGGIALLISGIVGPGRFKRHFDLVLYLPRDGGAFTKFVKVATYTVNPEITNGKLIVNGTTYDEFTFENGIFEKVYKQDTFIEGTVHYFWIESGEYKSNKALVSFYDPKDFTPKEIEEIETQEYEEETKYTVQEAREKYLQDRYAHTGSWSLGVMAAGFLILVFEYVVASLIRLAIT